MKEEILEVKRRLYLLLLNKKKVDRRGLTYNETELLSIFEKNIFM